MAVGSYGTIRPADVLSADVEIFYHYVSGRTSNSPVTFKKISAIDILTPVVHTADTTDVVSAQNKEILGGMYNLKLDSSIFSELGIYTLYIRPKQIRTKITDCGVLSSLPSVRGIVIDLGNGNVSEDDLPKFIPQGLVGYRVEYLNDDGTKKVNDYKIVTSNFYSELVPSNLTNSKTMALRYRYTDNARSTAMFLTLTPTSSPSNRPNTIPNIGQTNDNIILTNTYFNPTMIEIEMVEHDSSTLANALYGNQTKAIANGIYTIYDSENNIYRQYNLYEIKDEINETIFEVRERRTNIDESLNFDVITNI